MAVLRKLTLQQTRHLLLAGDGADIPLKKRDEMAIPSYLHPNPLIRWLMWRRYEVVAELARLDPAMSVLEFGCGIGLFLPTLCQEAGTVYALDLFPQFAQHLAGEMDLNVRFIDSIEELPDHSLDLIVAADVLEHIEEVERYVQLFWLKLAPGGRLLVSGPTENWVYQLGRVAAGFAGKGDYHVTNIDRLVPVITGCGFRQNSQRTLPFRLPPTLFRVLEFGRIDREE